MTTRDGERPLEPDVLTDLSSTMSYSDYLRLDDLLSAQAPLSSPPHPDELLFIIQHQTTELWLKLMLQELFGAVGDFDRDDAERARKSLARVKHILKTITEQWSVLATLTPPEYAEFRGVLGVSSGFQSAQYRAVEFLLGNKHRRMVGVFAGDDRASALVTGAYDSPTVYDAALRWLARGGLPVPTEILERDVHDAWIEHPDLVPVLRTIYGDRTRHWEAYAVCEDLVDIEDAFQLWRFRHLRTVQRTIGFGSGTGGSSGAAFLRAALDLTFFPELISVRTASAG